jgi:cytochrome c biogenesis factor
MPSLQAVLRSNYWLWSHVTTINIGYATVLLAAIFSMIYVFCRLFDINRQNKALFRMLTQSSYGILCFGLVFSLVGTVLGGIWGNESWGRFWGWDPKENGAMVIVLWCLAVLHMRLAGWVKELGLHLCTAFGANFCLFSWWHVNLLGVGLHSYGFTQGLEQYLFIAYGVVSLVVLLGGAIKLLESAAVKSNGSGGLPPAHPAKATFPTTPPALPGEGAPA